MRKYLGLERNVVVVSAVVFLLGFGEELWKRYLPKYLEALGAGASRAEVALAEFDPAAERRLTLTKRRDDSAGKSQMPVDRVAVQPGRSGDPSGS